MLPNKAWVGPGSIALRKAGEASHYMVAKATQQLDQTRRMAYPSPEGYAIRGWTIM